MAIQRRLSHDPRTGRLVDTENFLGEQRLEELDDVERIARGHPIDPVGEPPGTGRGAHMAHLMNHPPELFLG